MCDTGVVLTHERICSSIGSIGSIGDCHEQACGRPFILTFVRNDPPGRKRLFCLIMSVDVLDTKEREYYYLDAIRSSPNSS